MKTYEIRFSANIKKDLRKLPRDVQKRILGKITELAVDPRKGNVRPMVGSTSWRLRVGDYRVIYDIHDDKIEVLIVKIAHRREAYRKK